MNTQVEVELLNTEVISFINLDGITSPFNETENKMYMSCTGGCSSGCSCYGGLN